MIPTNANNSIVHQVVLKKDGPYIQEEPVVHNPTLVVEWKGRWCAIVGDSEVEGYHCAVGVPTTIMSKQQFEEVVRSFWSALAQLAEPRLPRRTR